MAVMRKTPGNDAGRLEGFTWHGCRHTFASRLVMAGVDVLSVKQLGGWKTLAMVQRYAHLSPDHLRGAVERLAPLSNYPVTIPSPLAVSGTLAAGVS